MTSARSSCSEERRPKPEALDRPVSERHLLPTQVSQRIAQGAQLPVENRPRCPVGTDDGVPQTEISYLLRSWVEPHEPLAPGAVPPPTQAGGFPNRQQLVERYEQRTGRELRDLDYWLAFNAWRSAAIGEGVYRRYLDGAMGERPDDLDRYARGVEFSMAAGLQFAGLAD